MEELIERRIGKIVNDITENYINIQDQEKKENIKLETKQILLEFYRNMIHTNPRLRTYVDEEFFDFMENFMRENYSKFLDMQ